MIDLTKNGNLNEWFLSSVSVCRPWKWLISFVSASVSVSEFIFCQMQGNRIESKSRFINIRDLWQSKIPMNYHHIVYANRLRMSSNDDDEQRVKPCYVTWCTGIRAKNHIWNQKNVLCMWRVSVESLTPATENDSSIKYTQLTLHIEMN